jgi:hypothetical protein
VKFVADLYDLTMLDKVKFGEHEYVDVILSKKDRSGVELYFSNEIGIKAFRDEAYLLNGSMPGFLNLNTGWTSICIKKTIAL